MVKVRSPRNKPSVITEFLNRKVSVNELLNDSNIVFSFKHLDNNQGSSFSDWNSTDHLIDAVNTLRNMCSSTRAQLEGNDFMIVYGAFPRRSNFTHPPHVPEDAEWCRVHVNGDHILAGHIFKNIFYLVFLDPDHTFCKTKRD